MKSTKLYPYHHLQTYTKHLVSVKLLGFFTEYEMPIGCNKFLCFLWLYNFCVYVNLTKFIISKVVLFYDLRVQRPLLFLKTT